MNVYLITRNCLRHDEVDPRTGPPIAAYTTDAEAQYRLTDWKVAHPWDENTYRVLELPAQGNPDEYKDKDVYIVIRLCTDIPACEDNTNCGPPIIACYSKICAIDSIQTWRQSHPNDKAYFQIKRMELKGKQERRSSKFSISRLFENVDI